MHKRERLKEIFIDTQNFYQENETLAAAVEYGRQNTALYEADDYPALPEGGERAGEIRLTQSRTFEAAIKLSKEYPDKKIAVLNFASAVTPGGGAKWGSSAQEESLCRCSTLYSALDRRWLWQKYYDVNRASGDKTNTDACIYTPGVVICKSDTDFPERLSPEEFVTVDVITCAAPDLREAQDKWVNPATGKLVRMNPAQLYELHVARASHILHVAAVNHVDILVLGAFGCGAFHNDPYTVAKAYRRALMGYRSRFDLVEFAIYFRDFETENFKAFQYWFDPAYDETPAEPQTDAAGDLKLAVVYDSQTGNTKQAAEWIAAGMCQVPGVCARAYSVQSVDEEFVKAAKGVVIGSPSYCALETPDMRTWLHEKAMQLELGGKLGGAFATAQYTHGGGDLVIQSILTNELCLGMLCYSSGSACGKPYFHVGPVAVNNNQEPHNGIEYYKDNFMIYGKRFAEKAEELFG